MTIRQRFFHVYDRLHWWANPSYMFKVDKFFFCFFSLLTRFTWQRLTPVTNISVFWRFTTRCVHKRNLNKIGDNAWLDPRRYNKATLAERLRKKKKPLINKMSQMAAYCHILLVQIIRSTDLKSNKKLIFLINISLISQYHVS